MKLDKSFIHMGMTGGIASGKNYVASLFEKKGCYTLDADEVSRIVMKNGGLAYDGIIAVFGADILDDHGDIDRTKLRAAVVASDTKRKLLESIVHPAVFKYNQKWASDITSKNDKAILISHAPLLLEAGAQNRYNGIILVWVDRDTQIKRLKQRGTPPIEDALKLMQTQMPLDEKVKYADFIINNAGTQEDTVAEVDRVYAALKLMQYAFINNRKHQ